MAGEIPRYWRLSTILDVWENNASQTLDTASKKQGVVEQVRLEAARHIILAIGNARVYFGSSLVKAHSEIPFDKFQHFLPLRTLVEEFEKKPIPRASSLAVRIQSWINALPIAEWKPRVTHLTPSYFTYATKEEGSIHLRGFFKYAMDPKYCPTLELNGTIVKPANTSEHNLEFKISLWLADETKKTFKIATLKIPYETGYVRTVIEIAEYRLWLGAQPKSLGTFKVHFTSPANFQERRVERVFEARIEKGDDATPWIKKQFRFLPPQDTWILPWSVNYKEQRPLPHGTLRTINILKIDPQEVVVEVGMPTHDLSFTLIGLVEFYSSPKTAVSQRACTYDLLWNKPITIAPEPYEIIFKTTLDTFEGSHHEFGGMVQHPYLVQSNCAQGYTITSFIPPDTLILP